MAYICRRRFLLGDDEWREYGDLVPEAAGWRNVHAYVGSGVLDEIADDQVEDQQRLAEEQTGRRPYNPDRKSEVPAKSSERSARSEDSGGRKGGKSAGGPKA